jgi:prevent-host-death family protein
MMYIIHIIYMKRGLPMTKVSTVELREQLGDLLNRVAYAGERVVILRRGKPVAAIVSMEDLQRLEALAEPGAMEAAHG